jgi:hypothetical protein
VGPDFAPPVLQEAPSLLHKQCVRIHVFVGDMLDQVTGHHKHFGAMVTVNLSASGHQHRTFYKGTRAVILVSTFMTDELSKVGINATLHLDETTKGLCSAPSVEPDVNFFETYAACMQDEWSAPSSTWCGLQKYLMARINADRYCTYGSLQGVR